MWNRLPIHAALQVTLTELAALVVIDATMTSQASEILLHQGLAFGVMIQWKGPTLWRCGLGDDLTAARTAEGAHIILSMKTIHPTRCRAI